MRNSAVNQALGANVNLSVEMLRDGIIDLVPYLDHLMDREAGNSAIPIAGSMSFRPKRLSRSEPDEFACFIVKKRYWRRG